ncbi:MAG: 5-(carboxyamino)imidazole ribonucleotide mutase [Candidatus Omnitrophica bacterium]|nr:5-(carboxyamino)imidazole ribonucleotide mutase [Candidatus Omnitrophota bacterium]
MKKVLVGIIVGSKSDLPFMEETIKTLKSFKIPYELKVLSAHRNPEETAQYAKKAEKRGIEVIIAAAGLSAHLAGALAARTLLPVIGVPVPSEPLGGIDSFLSTLQMPSGIPVATMSIGKSGAKNSAILAAEILALKYPEIKKRLKEYKKS